jgi:hypothetical protein
MRSHIQEFDLAALKVEQTKASQVTIHFGNDSFVRFRRNPTLKVNGRLIREPFGQSIRIAMVIGSAQIDDRVSDNLARCLGVRKNRRTSGTGHGRSA